MVRTEKQESERNASRTHRSPSGRAADRAADPIRRARIAVLATYGGVVAGVTLPTPLYVTFQERWTLTNAAVTGLYALYPAAVLAVLLVAGHWSDTLGRRRVLHLAIALAGASAIVFLLADSPWAVAAARVLTGLSSGFAVNAANALLIDLAPDAFRRRASMVSTAVNQVGIGLGALASAALVQYAWWPSRLPFAVHLALMMSGLLALRALPRDHAIRTGGPRVQFERLRLPRANRRRFAAASLAAFAAFALCGLLAALSPAIVRSELSTANVLFPGLAVAAVFLVSGASQPLWARWDDSMVFRAGAASMVASLAMLLAAVTHSSLGLFLVASCAGGAAVGALFMSSLSSINLSTESTERARVTATYFFVTFLGLIVPVVTTGALADLVGFTSAMATFAGTTVLATVLALVCWGRKEGAPSSGSPKGRSRALRPRLPAGPSARGRPGRS